MNKKNEQKGLEFKRLNAQITLVESKADDDKGIIEAYVSMFDNVDLGGDKIIKGAFSESLQKKLPKGVWMHNWDIPVAKTLIAQEHEKGLYIKAQFNLETQRGKDAYSDVKFGIIDEFSIGYRVLDHEWQEDGTRVLKKVKLYEWSPVLAGMNPDTELIGIKSDEQPEKVKFVKVDQEKKQVVIYYKSGKKSAHQLTSGYLTYLKSLDNKGAKVELDAEETKKIIRIRQVVKQIDKGAEYLLRITK